MTTDLWTDYRCEHIVLSVYWLWSDYVLNTTILTLFIRKHAWIKFFYNFTSNDMLIRQLNLIITYKNMNNYNSLNALCDSPRQINTYTIYVRNISEKIKSPHCFVRENIIFGKNNSVGFRTKLQLRAHQCLLFVKRTYHIR